MWFSDIKRRSVYREGMPASEDRRRGSYAKGIAKREEMLSRALDVIAREGYAGASVKELAAAVGLSQGGLLHYFDSKEELFTAILRKRDEVDLALFDGPGAAAPSGAGTASSGDTGDSGAGTVLFSTAGLTFDELRDGFLAVIRHNSEVPGLVQLFSRMAVDAADPAHPAHGFFLERGERLREAFVHALADAQAAGRVRSDVDPAMFARVYQAVADGMQLQWMLEPDVDMAAAVDALFAVLTTEESS